MKVYLVYNIDAKYMDSFIEGIFDSRDKADTFCESFFETTRIVEWEVE